MLDKLKEIIEKGSRSLTNDDRNFIKETSLEILGVEFVKMSGCKSCDTYHDQAILLYNKIKNDEAAKLTEPKYILDERVRVLFKGEKIYPEMMTDEIAERLLKNKFPKYWFTKKPDEAEN